MGEGTFVCDKGQYVERALQWGFLLDGKKLQDLSETRMMPRVAKRLFGGRAGHAC